MDSALISALVAAFIALSLKGIDWLLSRSGRQLAGRKDLREDLDLALKQIAELRQELKDEREARRNLQTAYDELLHRYQLLAIEVATNKREAQG